MPVHKRGFRLTVTEWIQEGVRDANIDLIEILDAWKKIYKAVANIVEAGYLHRDLSFGNVRVRRTSGNEILVKLIDFDLVEIESLDSARTAPDRTGTIPFMPIDILNKTKPPRRQEQHEDEKAFWVGVLALFKRFFRGHDVKQLWSEEAAWSLSHCKGKFITDLCLFHQSSWFEEPIPKFQKYADFSREACIKLAKEQSGEFLPRFEYPDLDIRTDGQRQQALNHQRINPRVCQILENAVRVLREEAIPDLVDSFKVLCP